MDMKARMAFEPLFYARMFMGRVVVNNQMQIQVGRYLLVNHVQEFDPLLVTMSRHARSNQSPLDHFNGGKKGCGSVAQREKN